MTDIYDYRCPLTAGLQAAQTDDLLRRYFDLLHVPHAQAARHVCAHFNQAADLWHKEAVRVVTPLFAAAMDSPGPRGEVTLDFRALALPPFSTFFSVAQVLATQFHAALSPAPQARGAGAPGPKSKGGASASASPARETTARPAVEKTNLGPDKATWPQAVQAAIADKSVASIREAFTKYPLLQGLQVDGKAVCINHLMFKCNTHPCPRAHL